MKILKIKIKNINCLRCEWEIDFQSPPLSHAGLFAITGPTGSGKSTILDAITLALFNKIPRFESDTISKNFIEKSGSIITMNETDSFVEVEYSCSRGIFRSKWSIATNKRGGLRETDMELVDVSTNRPILSGKKEVPKKNTELIGLTYDQFIKSILLSQGEFARFLKSKKDERGKLLEDITGMTVYRELGKRAFEKFKEKNEAIKFRIETIESEETQLVPQEKEDELEQLIQTINKEIQNGEANRAAIEKAIEIKSRIESIENEIEKYNLEQEQVNTTLGAFNEKNAQRIFKHEQLLPHIHEIRNYFNIHDSIKNITEEIQKKEPELENKRRAVNETVNAINILTGQKTDMQNAIKVLTDFRDRVIFYTTKKINAEDALSQQKMKFANHLKRPNLIRYKSYETSVKIDELKSKLCKEISSIISSTEGLINHTKIKTVDIDKQKESLSARLRAMEDLKNHVENYADNRKKNYAKEKQINEVSELINNSKPQLENITASKNLVSLKINEVREKREKKLREKNLEEDRELLRQGEPCPLCGSLHHPYVHEYFNNVTELTKELQSLENEENEYEAKKQDLQNEISAHSGTLETLQTEKSGIEREMKEQETKIASRKKQLAIENIKNVNTIEVAKTELEKSIEAINKFEKFESSKKELEDFKGAVDELILRTSEFVKAKSEVELRYKGRNIRSDCDLLSKQLKELNDEIQSTEATLNSNKNQLKELNNQQAKIEASVNAIFSAFGYSDILSSFADILPDAEFNNLKQQLSDLEGNIKRMGALIQGANERKRHLPLNDDTAKSKEELLDELNATLQQIEQEKQNLAENRAQKMQNEERKKRIIRLKQLVHETRQANLKWELLSKYIGDAQGKTFSTFAQGLTLRKLVLLTNERLQKLNDRYLLDMPVEEEDDDLIIIDTYLGEERRSVKTLSGGETFIVSLALALALSDLASKNVKIESLYIDEGFGSLDPEALDVAISTLEQLQVESNKTIGIISHVDSLKERIETQIQLEKNSSGFSKIIIK
jgi:DNA repair protein SbcC/Rad50